MNRGIFSNDLLVGISNNYEYPDNIRNIAFRYSLGQTMESIGKTLGVTRERIHQLLHKYVDKEYLKKNDK